MKQKENAEIIREEIHAIHGKFGTFLNNTPPIPEVPCPFSASLLNMSWDVDLTEEHSYFSDSFLLDAGMGSWDGGAPLLLIFAVDYLLR